MKTIAIIGTGIMGNGIASNFLKKGYRVLVWNRNKEKTSNLVEQGAVAVESAKAATEQADIVFEVTADDSSSRQVWLSDDGILAGAKPETILIASATLSHEWINELGKTCSDKGLDFFDIPMTNGRYGAENGKLVLLVGGDKEKLEQIEPELSAISEQIFYFGPVGSGTKFKLILQMVQAVHLVAFGDAMRIAKKEGMDVNAVGDALSQRMGGTTAMAWRDYNPQPNPINFFVELIAKDLRYVKNLAGELATPLLDEALKQYEAANKQGRGKEDWTTVMRD